MLNNNNDNNGDDDTNNTNTNTEFYHKLRNTHMGSLINAPHGKRKHDFQKLQNMILLDC